MKYIVKFWMIILFLSIFGCGGGNIGRNFDDTFVSKIEKNVTTKSQIRQNIGDPSSITTTSMGEVWTYMFTDAYGQYYVQAYTSGLYKANPTNKNLTIFFTGDTVTEFSYTR